MKIRLISDCHFEFHVDERLFDSEDADVLVIAGDLAVGGAKVTEALKRFANNVEDVIYVTGNHEYYGSSISETNDYISNAARNTNIHFLDCGTKQLDDVVFIGANLWSNFNNNLFSKRHCAQAINDFRQIKGFTAQDCVDLNTKHTKFFETAYNLPGKKVFVSHFLPDRICIDEQYKGESSLNDYFANNLGNWLQDLNNSIWFHGHTHSLVNTEIGSTRVIANPYGYNRNASYKSFFITV